MIIQSFNGGGIRGLIIAFQMRLAEAKFGKEKKVDIYAGTSVGSILACLRALGYSWPDICNFFVQYGKLIFKKTCIPRVFRSKYLDRNINELLKRFIGENKMIQDVSGCILVIPTIDTSNDSLKIWTNRGEFKILENGKYIFLPAYGENAKLWEIVRASASAPRYFSRFKMNGRYFEDGGIKANNPSQIAYTIARYVTSEPIHILSVTTGRKVNYMTDKQANDGIQVASHVIDSAIDAVDRNTNSGMIQTVRDIDNYVRVETILERSNGKVDDSSDSNIKNMLLDADLTFCKNMSKYENFFTKDTPPN